MVLSSASLVSVCVLLLLLGAIATTIIGQFGLLRWENCRRPLITLLVTLQLTHTWFSPLQLFFAKNLLGRTGIGGG